jgi:hypothetical protein
MEFSAMKKVSAFQSVRILPKPIRLFLSEDDMDVAVPMQAYNQRPSLERCQADTYTVARNIRVMTYGRTNPVCWTRLESCIVQNLSNADREHANNSINTRILPMYTSTHSAGSYRFTLCRQLSVHTLQAAISSQLVTSRCCKVLCGPGRLFLAQHFIWSLRLRNMNKWLHIDRLCLHQLDYKLLCFLCTTNVQERSCK